MNKVKLFCFPYAGGSANLYGKWQGLLDPRISLRPVELAGRGRRSADPLYDDLAEAVEDVYHLVKEEVVTQEYFLLGHSMGALIAYQLAQKIRREKLPPPARLFLSGKGAVHVTNKDNQLLHLLPDEEFEEEIRRLGATPATLFDHPELMAFLLPLLRCDFKMAHTDLTGQEIEPLRCPITVWLGKDDNISRQEGEAWGEHTTNTCDVRYFDGGHFFINDQPERLTSHINDCARKLEAGKLFMG